MSRMWRFVSVVSLLVLFFGVALIGVGYFGGSSVQRLLQTTDISDMTKFASREQLAYWVDMVFSFFGA